MKNLTLPFITDENNRITNIFFFGTDEEIEKEEKRQENIINQWLDVIGSKNFKALEITEISKIGVVSKLVLSTLNNQLRVSSFFIHPKSGTLYATSHENYDCLRDAAKRLAYYNPGTITLI